jgi:hypothetical protein
VLFIVKLLLRLYRHQCSNIDMVERKRAGIFKFSVTGRVALMNMAEVVVFIWILLQVSNQLSVQTVGTVSIAGA